MFLFSYAREVNFFNDLMDHALNGFFSINNCWVLGFSPGKRLSLTYWYLVKILGIFLPAVVRPILDSYEAAKQVPQPALNDVSI